MQFVTITQPLLNSLQSHVSPTLIVISHLPFLFSRKLRVLDVIFHTFNCRLLELIKIKTLNFTSNELLSNCTIYKAIKKRYICLWALTVPFEYMLNFCSKRFEMFPYCYNHHLSNISSLSHIRNLSTLWQCNEARVEKCIRHFLLQQFEEVAVMCCQYNLFVH